MILDRLPRWLVKFIVWLYKQIWYHWFASILLGFWDTLFGALYRTQEKIFGISLWKDWQHRPCPPYPIPMTDDDVPVKPERCDACGQYIATMLVTYVPVAHLIDHLPKDAELDPSRIHMLNGQAMHSVIYMLGYTENLKRVWNPLPGINYMEFAVGIPNVRIKRPNGYDFPFFYLPTLYLSRFYPVLMGWMVGYRKHWGWVYGEDNTYHITKLTGQKILSATFEIGSLPPRIMGGPNAVHWRELLDQPHANPFGPDDFLYLHYHWDWQDALLQPVSADVEVFEGLPGLPPGKYHFNPLNTGEWIDGMAPVGAFRLCAPFELLSPFDRKDLERWRIMMNLVPATGTPPPPGGGAPPTDTSNPPPPH